jgi:ribosome-binding protein aMBF1 (putative translation factor)
MKPFDSTDRRCIFPVFGKQTDTAMKAKAFTNTALAAKLGIDHTAVAGYRRGFSRPTPERAVEMGKLLGVQLDMSEARPSKRNSAPVPNDPRLAHLAALALGMGFQASFTPVTA